MNKNPFVPNPPSFSHQQPPLPPGPPPAQPGATDYSAYWNAAAQHQQNPSGAQPSYNPQWPGSNPQWSASQPPAAAAPAKSQDQTSLFANYGYGNHWQHQHQHQYPHPTPPVPAAPVAIPTQPPYNPYQPQAASSFPQPYVPPAGGIPQQQPPPQQFRPPPPPQQTFFPPPPAQVHQTPPQFPPAKRQRFDNSHSNPPPPRVQPPPPPGSQSNTHTLSRQSSMSSMHGQPQSNFSGGMNRGGMGGRGGGMGQNRGGRGGQSGGNRGFGSNRGGRGGGTFGSGGRGGGNAGGQSGGGGALRAHRSGDRGSFSSNFNRRGGGGGSFNNHHHYQGNQNNLYRNHGRGGMSHGRNNRADNQNKPMGSYGSKKDEQKRTFTDFKVVGLEIQNLDWRWGHIPHMVLAAAHTKAGGVHDAKAEEKFTQKAKGDEDELDLIVTTAGENPKGENVTSTTSESSTVVNEPVPVAQAASSVGAYRLRIFFHTPPTADDARLVTHSPQDSRKGKRKKLDDDDGDYDEVRTAPAPPVPGGSLDGEGDKASASVTANAEGRASVAPSIAETASEADWLMAAIADGDADAEGYDETQGEDADGVYDIDETMTDTGTHADEQVPDIEEGDQGEDASHDDGGTDVSHGTGNNTQAAKPNTGEVSLVVTSTDQPASASANINGGSGFTHKVPDPAKGIANVATSGHKLPVKMEVHALPPKPLTTGEHDHLPEPPASPVSNTVHSNSSSGSATQAEVPSTPKKAQPSNMPAANRLSITFAGGTRRLVINSEVVETLKIFRADGRIEVSMTVERSGESYKGIWIEALSDETKAYTPLLNLSESSESDSTLPPFWCFAFPTQTKLIVYLDKQRPFTEPKWLKTGDVQDHLKTIFGRMFWVTGDAVGWEKKIEVVDPDPAPTILSVLESWSTNTTIGLLNERQRFLKTHMTEPENILEILLRLVRGERATAFTQGSSISQPSITGPLLAALNPESAHASQQTHVSLAVVALVHMAKEYAEKALGLGGKAIVDERVGEVIRSLPSHLLYKSLDGMFKEWRMDKKQGR